MPERREDAGGTSTKTRLTTTVIGRPGRTVSKEVDELVGAALRLSLEPGLTRSQRLQELLMAADFDSGLLGRAWLHLTIERLRWPSETSVDAAGLVSDALDLNSALAAVACA